MTRHYDRVFAIGGILLCIATLPALVHGIHTPVWTAAITTMVLVIFAVTYLAMKYYLAATTLTIQVGLWIFILIGAIH